MKRLVFDGKKYRAYLDQGGRGVPYEHWSYAADGELVEEDRIVSAEFASKKIDMDWTRWEEVDDQQPPQDEPDQRIKQDTGKLRLSLVPSQIIRDIAQVREYGAAKYGTAESWQSVDPQRYRDAAYRHFLSYIDDPNSVDEESGILHRKHLECNLAFLAALEKE